MINLRGSELPGLPGLEYCPRSSLDHYLRWSDLVWSGAQQVALRVFIAIDADADPTTIVKIQSGPTMYGMGMIHASIFNLI